MVEEIKGRKKRILTAIIREHILTAEPVGSRTLAKTNDFGISSATIRNEMSDLEDMGYLEQPYTSAGRIPSDKAYRFYVNSLIKDNSFPNTEYHDILKNIIKEKQSIQSLMSNMTKMLSDLTRYTAMISEPQLKGSKIKHIQFVKVRENSLLVVLITDTGIVHNKTVKISQDLDSDQIRYLNEFITCNLKDRELLEITEEMLQELELILINRLNLSQGILRKINKNLQKIFETNDFNIYLGGTSYILEQPEFNDITSLKKFLNILDHEEILKNLLNNIPDQKIRVMIGQENKLEAMHDCSFVFATYSIGGNACGKIGVIGPTRMKYPEVISAVSSVACILEKIIKELSG